MSHFFWESFLLSKGFLEIARELWEDEELSFGGYILMVEPDNWEKIRSEYVYKQHSSLEQVLKELVELELLITVIPYHVVTRFDILGISDPWILSDRTLLIPLTHKKPFQLFNVDFLYPLSND